MYLIYVSLLTNGTLITFKMTDKMYMYCIYKQKITVFDGKWPSKEMFNEWVSDCCLTPSEQFISVYHDEKKLNFVEMMMMSALYQTNMFSWIFEVLAHWNNSP